LGLKTIALLLVILVVLFSVPPFAVWVFPLPQGRHIIVLIAIQMDGAIHPAAYGILAATGIST
jgi:uncharacterized protein YqfA (UPF0365 family)